MTIRKILRLGVHAKRQCQKKYGMLVKKGSLKSTRSWTQL